MHSGGSACRHATGTSAGEMVTSGSTVWSESQEALRLPAPVERLDRHLVGGDGRDCGVNGMPIQVKGFALHGSRQARRLEPLEGGGTTQEALRIVPVTYRKFTHTHPWSDGTTGSRLSP